MNAYTAADVAALVNARLWPAWADELSYLELVTAFELANTGHSQYTLSQIKGLLAAPPTTAADCTAHIHNPSTLQQEPAFVRGTLKAIYTRLLIDPANWFGPLHGFVPSHELELAISAIFFYAGVGCRAIRYRDGYIVEAIGADLEEHLPCYPQQLPRATTSIFTLGVIDRIGALERTILSTRAAMGEFSVSLAAARDRHQGGHFSNGAYDKRHHSS